MGNFKDLTNQKFGRLTVKYQNGRNKHGQVLWYCECECTNNITIPTQYLTSGNTKSCGCLRKELLTDKNKKYNTYDLSGKYGIGYTSNTNEPFYFDLEDYELIKEYCWESDTNGYILTQYQNQIILLHRFIMGVENKDITIDHIKIKEIKNNQKYNLRICTMQQNSFNRGIRSNNKTGITGVYWSKSRNKWIAQIKINYKHKYLGSFNDFEKAVEIRRQAEEKYFGEYSFNNSQKYAEQYKLDN